MNSRNSGVLLHITSLPGKEGIGTLGAEARKFIDLLAEANQQIWQILPLGPTGYGHSPYLSYSAFAGNPLLVDLSALSKEGLLPNSCLKNTPRFSNRVVRFDEVEKWKNSLLTEAFNHFSSKSDGALANEYEKFLKEHGWWLDDFALFMAVKFKMEGRAWFDWPEKLKFRDAGELKRSSDELAEEIERVKFIQFLFFRQWHGLKEYADSKNVGFLGDMPLYVAGDSVDVWANSDLFMMDRDLNPSHVGGVPPDYFSDTGQLWGCPVYRWDRLEERQFDWWLARLHFNINMFNRVRIDHFRGLESFWAVPATKLNAIEGEWLPAKGYKLLQKFREQVGDLPLVAENLGVITSEVERLRKDFNLPGMKVIQFAFGSDAKNEHLPHNYSTDDIAFSGTHDNNSTLGWLCSTKGEERKMAMRYLAGVSQVAVKEALRQIWASAAQTTIAPVQDLLLLGSKARFNTPGTVSGNWLWRLKRRDLSAKTFTFIAELTKMYNR